MEKINNSFVWEDYAVKQLEIKHRLTGQAKTDGLTDTPKSNAEGYSVVENELKNECDTYLERHINKLRDFLISIENKQNQLSGYLKQNHFVPIVSKLSADFNTLANEKKIKLSDYKNSYDTYFEEQNAFKRYHQLSREPNSATTTKTVIAGLLIAGLLIIELFANTAMLSPAMVGGKAEGLSIAGSVAFLNVFISSFVGFYVIKNFNHIEKAQKVFFGVLGGVYFLLIIYINAALGAYRSQAENVFNKQLAGDSGLSNEQMTEILRNSVSPWNVDFSFLGIVLTFIGIAFAFIAIVDGLTYNDHYPGYGKVGQNVNKYKDLIKKTIHEYANDVASMFSRYNSELQNKLTVLLNNDLNNWDFNANLIQKEFVTYENKVKDLEEKTIHMIDEYRNENKRVRKTEPPKYFIEPFSINNEKKDPIKVFKEAAFHYMNDEIREKTKIEYSESIEQRYKTSEAEVENIQKKSEEVQKTLHDTYNT
jgi:hypothetical protein